MRGRKAKPTAVRELAGNPGKRPLNQQEPAPPELDSNDVTPPELLDNAEALSEWRRLLPMLRQCRQITEADRAALLALCLEWARYLLATRETKRLGLIVKAPSGYPIQNPYLAIATRALSSCNRLWPELGLTPSSRSRVIATAATGPGPGGDEFSEFDDVPAWTAIKRAAH